MGWGTIASFTTTAITTLTQTMASGTAFPSRWLAPLPSPHSLDPQHALHGAITTVSSQGSKTLASMLRAAATRPYADESLNGVGLATGDGLPDLVVGNGTSHPLAYQPPVDANAIVCFVCLVLEYGYVCVCAGDTFDGAMNEMYHNEGNGVFTSVTNEITETLTRTMGVSFVDLDGCALALSPLHSTHGAMHAPRHATTLVKVLTTLRVACISIGSHVHLPVTCEPRSDGDLDLVLLNSNEANQAFRNNDGRGGWTAVGYSFTRASLFRSAMAFFECVTCVPMHVA